eukprot:8124031-Pyramimonas_sp.AAC.1
MPELGLHERSLWRKVTLKSRSISGHRAAACLDLPLGADEACFCGDAAQVPLLASVRCSS